MPRLIALLAIAFACDSGQLMTVENPPDEPERIKLDSGVVRQPADAAEPEPVEEDAGMMAAPDAAVPSDGGVTTESCGCPELSACAQPVADAPLFSKTDDRFLGQLFNLFACAEHRIQLAMYQTDLTCVVDALIARLDAAPDLEVSLVIDDDECPRGVDGMLTCDLRRLEAHARTQIVDDARSRFMHHKFAVVDDAFVWTGSGNLTERSVCTDYNDAVVIEQPAIVAAFSAEFDRMFTTREFGPHAEAAPYVGGPYTVYFGPESPIADPPSWHLAILQAIREATTSIDLMVFAWTHTDIADALVEAYGRGVSIRGVVAPSYANDAPAVAAIAAGIPIRTASIHSKVLIIDGLRVVTGSPNWSQNSWANDEASVWIDDASVAAEYDDAFSQVWMISSPP